MKKPLQSKGLERATGFEPATSSLGSNEQVVLSENLSGVTASDSAACTSACTSDRKIDNETTTSADLDGGSATDSQIDEANANESLKSLASALLRLSGADRAKLLTMMGGS